MYVSPRHVELPVDASSGLPTGPKVDEKSARSSASTTERTVTVRRRTAPTAAEFMQESQRAAAASALRAMQASREPDVQEKARAARAENRTHKKKRSIGELRAEEEAGPAKRAAGPRLVVRSPLPPSALRQKPVWDGFRIENGRLARREPPLNAAGGRAVATKREEELARPRRPKTARAPTRWPRRSKFARRR